VRREEEIDVLYDLSAPYPPVSALNRPALNVGEIKTLLVTATAAGEEVRPLLEDVNLDPKLKSFGNFAMSLFKVIEVIVENGLVPMANGETTATGAATAARSTRGTPVPPKAPGIKELRDALDKAERESILFDADLGPNPLRNRSDWPPSCPAGSAALPYKMRVTGVRTRPRQCAPWMTRWDVSLRWISLVLDQKKAKPGQDRPPNSCSS
jgi:hypothetical protein